MGVEGLTTYIKNNVPILREKIVKGRNLHIDTNGWVFEIMGDRFLAGDYATMDKRIKTRVKLWRSYGLVPIAYFDGDSGSIKQKCVHKRKEQKLKAYDKIREYCEGEKKKMYMNKKLPCPPMVFEQIISTFGGIGVKVVQCRGEADVYIAKCAHEDKGYCYAKDSDFFMFSGINYIEFNSIKSNTVSVWRRSYIAEQLNITEEQFVELALLLGNDYTKHFTKKTKVSKCLEFLINNKGYTRVSGNKRDNYALQYSRELYNNFVSKPLTIEENDTVTIDPPCNTTLEYVNILIEECESEYTLDYFMKIFDEMRYILTNNENKRSGVKPGYIELLYGYKIQLLRRNSVKDPKRFYDGNVYSYLCYKNRGKHGVKLPRRVTMDSDASDLELSNIIHGETFSFMNTVSCEKHMTDRVVGLFDDEPVLIINDGSYEIPEMYMNASLIDSGTFVRETRFDLETYVCIIYLDNAARHVLFDAAVRKLNSNRRGKVVVISRSITPSEFSLFFPSSCPERSILYNSCKLEKHASLSYSVQYICDSIFPEYNGNSAWDQSIDYCSRKLMELSSKKVINAKPFIELQARLACDITFSLSKNLIIYVPDSRTVSFVLEMFEYHYHKKRMRSANDYVFIPIYREEGSDKISKRRMNSSVKVVITCKDLGFVHHSFNFDVSISFGIHRVKNNLIEWSCASYEIGIMKNIRSGHVYRLYTENSFDNMTTYIEERGLGVPRQLKVLHMLSNKCIDENTCQTSIHPITQTDYIGVLLYLERNGYIELNSPGNIKLTEAGELTVKSELRTSTFSMDCVNYMNFFSNDVYSLIICAIVCVGNPYINFSKVYYRDFHKVKKTHDDIRKKSDLISLLNLYLEYRNVSKNKMRKWCSSRYIYFTRMNHIHKLIQQHSSSKPRSIHQDTLEVITEELRCQLDLFSLM